MACGAGHRSRDASARFAGARRFTIACATSGSHPAAKCGPAARGAVRRYADVIVADIAGCSVAATIPATSNSSAASDRAAGDATCRQRRAVAGADRSAPRAGFHACATQAKALAADGAHATCSNSAGQAGILTIGKRCLRRDPPKRTCDRQR
jgi:hypothetical protein